MKKFVTLFLLTAAFFFPAWAQAKVYWLGRDIDMALQFGYHTDKDWGMVRAYGHSLLVIIPQNPARFAQLYNPADPTAYFKELEKDFGNGYKGFVIAAYAENGTQSIGHADGYLVARLNAPREMRPVRDFFARTNLKKWNFAAGEVYSPFEDEVFALRLLRRAQYYMAYTRLHPLPYGTVYSIIEPAVRSTPNKAVNCNAFAYSLVRYAGADKGPDLYALRVMPGIANLLPGKFFMQLPKQAHLLPFQKYTPRTLVLQQTKVKKALSAHFKRELKNKPAARKTNLLK